MSSPTDDTIVDIRTVRQMTPTEVVEASRAGRLDLAAIARDRSARDERRTRRVRQFVQNGATPAEAIATAAQIEAVIDEDWPPAAA